MADQEDRTEAATPRRLERALEERGSPHSREVAATAGLAAAALVLVMAAPDATRGLVTSLGGLLLLRLEPMGAAHLALGAGLAALAPLLGAVLFAGLAVGLLQTGFRLRWSGLLPDTSRLHPMQGIKRLFGPANSIEAAKAVVKLAVLSWATSRAVGDGWRALPSATLWPTGMLLDRLLRQVLHVMLVVLASQALIAVGDLAWVRLRHARGLRMSREEIKQEQKEQDGDPRIKARLKQIRLARTRRRMMAAVPQAAVVVTNPTHYAVALAYDRGKQAAPRVVAKGMDEVAARIRAVAAEHGVPLVANPPLARALYRVELDAEIPADHFQAVAEIIAWVWRLRSVRPREAVR